MTQEWLIDARKSLDDAAIRQLERSLPQFEGDRRGETEEVNLAVRVQDLIIHDIQKWFGRADIRLDVLVVHGNGEASQQESFYTPTTFRFPDVDRGERLSIGEKGLLIFYGKPRHFLDIFIMVSRDRQDSDDLSTLLSKQLNSEELQKAMTVMLGLAIAAPQAATAIAAIGAAATIGDFTYKMLRQVTGSTIGLYRNSYLEYRDDFGIGRHPEEGFYTVKDLSFWYEIVIDEDEQ